MTSEAESQKATSTDAIEAVVETGESRSGMGRLSKRIFGKAARSPSVEVLQQTLGSTGLVESTPNELFDMVDQNGDGSISREEFERLYKIGALSPSPPLSLYLNAVVPENAPATLWGLQHASSPRSQLTRDTACAHTWPPRHDSQWR